RRALSLRRRARATRPDVGRSAPDPAPVARIEPLGPDRTLADRPIRPRRLRTRRQGSPAHQPADRTHAPGERRSVRLRWPGSRRCNRTERTPTRRSGRPGPDRAAATGPNAPRPVDPADLARIAPLQPDRTHPDPSIRPTWPGSRRCNRTERTPTRRSGRPGPDRAAATGPNARRRGRVHVALVAWCRRRALPDCRRRYVRLDSSVISAVKSERSSKPL